MTVIISYVGGVEQEDGRTLTLGDILSFFTGSTRIPPMGFDDVGTLNFNSTNVFPTASTCSLTLTLPTLYYKSYSAFKGKMMYALFNHGGFGLLILWTVLLFICNALTSDIRLLW